MDSLNFKTPPYRCSYLPSETATLEYRELVPGRRLVKTWIYEGPVKEFEHHETLLTVELREVGPRLTELTLKHIKIKS